MTYNFLYSLILKTFTNKSLIFKRNPSMFDNIFNFDDDFYNYSITDTKDYSLYINVSDKMSFCDRFVYEGRPIIFFNLDKGFTDMSSDKLILLSKALENLIRYAIIYDQPYYFEAHNIFMAKLLIANDLVDPDKIYDIFNNGAIPSRYSEKFGGTKEILFEVLRNDVLDLFDHYKIRKLLIDSQLNIKSV